jgi:hypothetical protein
MSSGDALSFCGSLKATAKASCSNAVKYISGIGVGGGLALAANERVITQGLARGVLKKLKEALSPFH